MEDDGSTRHGAETVKAESLSASSRPFGRFNLGEVLGRGGMGTVYRAYDPLLHRNVALKILQQLDPENCIRFMREAQFQAQVEHPHICTVFEADSVEGVPYISMHLVEGPTLSQAFAELNREELLGILIQAAEGLHAAHRHGLVHRDMKPSNILLERREHGGWHAFVADFGLARLDIAQSLQLTTGLVGTPAYMAPEQLKSGNVDARADLYALGAILYHGLSGHPPFEGGTFAELLSRRIAQPEPRSLKGRVTCFHQDLEAVLLRCLETEPERRYASAFQFAKDLRCVLEGEPVSVQVPSLKRLAWKKLKRNRVATAALAAVVLVILLSGALMLRARSQTQHQVAWAQRLGQETREMAYLMRLEYMSPPHDLRPAKSRIRTRLKAIEGELGGLNGSALNAALLALGQGHLALQEPDQALPLLERAWNGGLQDPRAAQALGECHWQLVPKDALLTTNPAQEDARKLHMDAIRQYLPRALEGEPGEAELLRAWLALAENKRTEALAAATRSIQAAPWRYEALIARVGALWLRENDSALKFEGRHTEALQNSLEALHQALTLAPSDQKLRLMISYMILSTWMSDADRKRPDRKVLEEAFQQAEAAIDLDPGQPDAAEAWCSVVGREGFDLLNRGETPVPLIEKALERFRKVQVSPTELPNWHGYLGLWHWQIAEWKSRTGGDPAPNLREAMSHFRRHEERTGVRDSTEVDILISEGELLSRENRDPDPPLQEARNFLRSLMADPAKTGSYHCQLMGGVEFVQAQADLRRKRNPWPALEAGRKALQHGEAIDPNQVFILSQRGLLEALGVQAALRMKRDASPFLKEALRASRKACVGRPDYTRAWWGRAWACDGGARMALERGEDPTPFLTEGLHSVHTGLGFHPKHYALLGLEGSLLNLEAQWTALQGTDATPLRQRALACLKEARLVNPRDPDLARLIEEAKR
jgi:serine/threonine-protein kinase